jgi:hypothetical protein
MNCEQVNDFKTGGRVVFQSFDIDTEENQENILVQYISQQNRSQIFLISSGRSVYYIQPLPVNTSVTSPKIKPVTFGNNCVTVRHYQLTREPCLKQSLQSSCLWLCAPISFFMFNLCLSFDQYFTLSFCTERRDRPPRIVSYWGGLEFVSRPGKQLT